MRYVKLMFLRSFFIIAAVGFSAAAFPSHALAQPTENIWISDSKPLTLSEAIDTALKNNPGIDSMIRALQKAEYLSRAASKEGLPEISVDYTFTGFPTIVEMELEGVDDNGGNSSVPIVDNTSFVLGVHARMPIYTGGAMKYRKSIARLGIDVARLRLVESKADMIQEVTIKYHNILRLQNYSKVVAENLKRFIEHEDVTSQYFDVGLVAKNALLEIRAKRANVQQDMLEVEKDLSVAKTALNVLMGVDPDSVYILEELEGLREIPYSIGECFELAKENNPSLVVFTFLKSIALKSVRLQGTDLWPKLYGDISYFKHGQTPALKGDDYFTNDIVMGTVKADWKIFDWFKTTNLANAKKMEVVILVNKLRGIEDSVSLDIRQAHLAMKTAKNKFKVAMRGMEYAEENYRITKLRYEEKVSPSREVNDALVLLRRSQFNYYTAFYQYSVAVARLERIIGVNDGRGGSYNIK